jgi:hypothetical protein
MEVTAVTPSQSAMELLRRSVSCIKYEKYTAAAHLLRMGYALQRYDVERVQDETAHGAFQVSARRVFQALSRTQGQKLQAEMDRLSESKEARAPVCNQLRSMGPPSYTPSYMIKHGMQAVRSAMGADSVEVSTNPPEGFSPSAAWDTARAYADCVPSDE